jgi:anti-sigma B factor antagonist
MKLRLKTRVVNGINVIDCDGRIVIGEEIEALRETGHRLIVENPHIVLNLKNVINIDSSGLGMLVGLYTTAKNAHGEIKLAELTPRSDKLMQITKLGTVFEIFDKEADAVHSFAMAEANAS